IMNVSSKKKINRVVLILSIGLLLTSLTQKCFCTTSGCGDSLAAYFAGTIGFFLSWAGSTWLANPLLLTSWITINRNPKLSWTTSFLAVTLSLSFLFFNRIIEN